MIHYIKHKNKYRIAEKINNIKYSITCSLWYNSMVVRRVAIDLDN